MAGGSIGIDFGTTNTAVVCMGDDGHTRLLGEDGPFPSAVAIPNEGTDWEFGRAAREKRAALSGTHRVFTSLPSYLGTDHAFEAGAYGYTATDVTTEFLKYVKKAVADAHGVDISRASFSLPIGFSPEARRGLRKAAKQAGIEIASFINGPTAAYLANRKEYGAFSTVMALDWGGGALNVSILKRQRSEIAELAVSVCAVGGDDIDLALAGQIHAAIAAKSGAGVSFDDMQPDEKHRMLAQCEAAKRFIADAGNDAYSLLIPGYGVYGTATESLTAAQFDALAEPIIRDKVLPAIEDALTKASLSAAAIDAVMMVGGGSNLRLYEYVIANVFKGKKIHFPEKGPWSAAEGAALTQRMGGRFTLRDTLGVLLSDGTVFPVLEGEKTTVGDKRDPVTFSLTEDALDARFIFTDGKHTRATLHVPTKGYYHEKLALSAELTDDQTARLQVVNDTMGQAPVSCEIGGLTFIYNIRALER